ncbi:MAG: hypothetical protein NTW86_11650, partial [Candidatus Sumerlaeota bacterium]|nr:hypothetical protein [Candidatus Sumerlaeota bacterium]
MSDPSANEPLLKRLEAVEAKVEKILERMGQLERARLWVQPTTPKKPASTVAPPPAPSPTPAESPIRSRELPAWLNASAPAEPPADREAAAAQPFQTATQETPPDLPKPAPAPDVPPRPLRPLSPPRPPATPAAPTFDWKAFLRKINLWPPGGEETLEVQLGTWWASRLGALLAVIFAVFAAIYVSQKTAPWVRWTELAAFSVAMTSGGLWLERR